MGRDKDWKDMVSQQRLVGISCTHLGGDYGAPWVIEVDTGSRGEPTGRTIAIDAAGHDM